MAAVQDEEVVEAAMEREYMLTAGLAADDQLVRDEADTCKEKEEPLPT